MGSGPTLDYSLTFCTVESPGAKDIILVIGSRLHHVSGKNNSSTIVARTLFSGCCHNQYSVSSQRWGQQLSGEWCKSGFKAGVWKKACFFPDVFAAEVILYQTPLPSTAEKCEGFSSAEPEQGDCGVGALGKQECEE